MSDQTPDLWWIPTDREVWWRPDPTSVSAGILTLADEGTPLDALPTDAVKLVPEPNAFDEAVERQEIWDEGRQHGYNRAHHEIQEAERERDALRAEILAVLDEDGGTNWSTKLDRIRDILDRDARRARQLAAFNELRELTEDETP